MRAPETVDRSADAQTESAEPPTADDRHTDIAHLTFVATDPPRASWFARWTGAGVDDPDEVALLARPDSDGRVTIQATPVHRVELDELIAATATGQRSVDDHRILHGQGEVDEDEVDEDSASVRSWRAVVGTALNLIARGRIRPGLSDSGTDTWQIGALTPDERSHVEHLSAALPPTAHCAALSEFDRPAAGGPSVDADPDSSSGTTARHDDPSDLVIPPLEVLAPAVAVARTMDAVVDRFLRTAGASAEAGHRAFAVLDPVTIDARTALLKLEAMSSDRPPLLTLRLAPPEGSGSAFSATLVFQSRRDARLVVPASALWAAPDAVRQRFRHVENNLLLTLRRASRIWAPLQALLDQPLPTSIDLSEVELDDLAGPLANDLGACGLSVLWPVDLIGSIDLTPVVGSSPDATPIPPTGRTARLDLASLLELRWEGVVNGQKLTAAELKELADAKRSIIRLRGEWVRVDDDQIRRLSERRKIGATTALAAALGGATTIDGIEANVAVDGPLATLGDRLRARDPQRRLAPPVGLTADLRPYQERGLAWLVEMDELGLGGILADDMGLGKTVQVLGLHVQRQTSRPSPTLVICPTSVVGNWEREANRFAPGVPVVRYHGASRSLDAVGPGTILLTSYGVARRDAKRLSSLEWGLVIADEAQNIKNPTSRTARALRTIPGETRVALTGTPVQNQLADLWAILDWTTPGLLGPLERFRTDFATPIERDGDPAIAEQLHRLLRPFLLRRRKSDPDIAPDLPPKTETDEVVPLTAEQATLYQAVVDQVMAEINAATGIERRGLVLRLVTRLKQVCNHPVHLLGDDDDRDGHLPGRSGKLTAATDLIDVIVQEGEAALVFTQYVTMGHLLQAHFDAQGHRTLFLHGGLGVQQRETMVEAFQQGEADVFVVSLKAGGTGLNLTAATHVIHYDRWWNPAVEDQASDRAWRIGQDRPVQIHRLICEGTIEDRIAALLRDKRSLADAVVGSGEGWISELSAEDLAELVALSDRDRP